MMTGFGNGNFHQAAEDDIPQLLGYPTFDKEISYSFNNLITR